MVAQRYLDLKTEVQGLKQGQGLGGMPLGKAFCTHLFLVLEVQKAVLIEFKKIFHGILFGSRRKLPGLNADYDNGCNSQK